MDFPKIFAIRDGHKKEVKIYSADRDDGMIEVLEIYEQAVHMNCVSSVPTNLQDLYKNGVEVTPAQYEGIKKSLCSVYDAVNGTAGLIFPDRNEALKDTGKYGKADMDKEAARIAEELDKIDEEGNRKEPKESSIDQKIAIQIRQQPNKWRIKTPSNKILTTRVRGEVTEEKCAKNRNFLYILELFLFNCTPERGSKKGLSLLTGASEYIVRTSYMKISSITGISIACVKAMLSHMEDFLLIQSTKHNGWYRNYSIDIVEIFNFLEEYDLLDTSQCDIDENFEIPLLEEALKSVG